MGRKTICQHRYIIPQLADFYKKYYFLVTQLLFEYTAHGYYEDRLEVIGFNEMESVYLCEALPFFYQNGNALMIDDFDLFLLEQVISILPLEQQKMLVDHIVLSSIDGANNLKTLLFNLKNNIAKFGESFPSEYLLELDFWEFFKENDSFFMNDYYSSEEEKDELRLQFGLKR